MEQLLRMEDICKSFSEVKVLDKIKLELRQGEAHALLDENGADRSTLTKVLSGACTRDGGKIRVNGQKADITDVESAKRYGTRVIHQELMLISYMTVTGDIFLRQEPKARPGTMDTDKMDSETARFLVGMELSLKPADLVGKLNTAQQQMIEIIRATPFGTKIIVVDEPTSSLTDTKVEVLFKVIRKLKENGVGIIYIGHRMSELDIITDRITVMRDGEYVDTVMTEGTNHDKLVSLVMGRSLGDLYEKHCHATDGVALKIKHPLSGREVGDVTFNLRKGEVLGFSGLVESGRSETMKCIFGLRKREKGKIYISEEEAKISSVKDATGCGIGLVPGGRKREGIYTIRGVRFNATVKVLKEFLRDGRYDWDKELTLTKEYVDDVMQTKYVGMEQPVGRLSGGNQQKVIIGRWLLAARNILTLDEPIRSINVETKSDIYHLIDRLTAQGLSIILISSEVPGLINVYNRIVVMNQGYTTDVLEREEFSQERIMSLATIEL